jgi:ADP-glucose pyrophosphorylase
MMYLLVAYAATSISCTVQNCVVSDRVKIGNNCNLNECNIGTAYEIPAGTKIKNEAFSTKSMH